MHLEYETDHTLAYLVSRLRNCGVLFQFFFMWRLIKLRHYFTFRPSIVYNLFSKSLHENVQISYRTASLTQETRDDLYIPLWELHKDGIELHAFVIYQHLTSCLDASEFYFLLGSSCYPFNFLFIPQLLPLHPAIAYLLYGSARKVKTANGRVLESRSMGTDREKRNSLESFWKVVSKFFFSLKK
jgi:hypothetical protein